MPCYRCGARQSDPARGVNLWVRGVRANEQVLVCPDCQQTRGWSADLDHCSVCGATTLVRRLGQTVCRSCEASATAEFLAVESTMDRGFAIRSTGTGTSSSDSSRTTSGRHRRTDSRDLSADVATAIDRVLGRAAPRAPDGPASDATSGVASTQEQERVPPDGPA